ARSAPRPAVLVLDALDAPTLRRAMGLFAQALRAHREEIDSLNVFPVPDGDTGSNLLRTHEEVDRALSADPRADLQTTCELIARASLTGARGSSGVILALALRGLCGSLASAAEPGPAALATALAEASSQARRGLADPLEGTVLTVLRDAAGA